jgi:hypothetical protein
MVPLFFYRMSFDPLLFLGIPLFLSEVCVLIQQIKVIIMRIRSWLWLTVKVVIEYKASVATILTMVIDALRDKTYIIASGLHVLYLIKNQTCILLMKCCMLARERLNI